MLKIVKIPIADLQPYPSPLYINIGFGLKCPFELFDNRHENYIIQQLLNERLDDKPNLITIEVVDILLQ